MEISDKFGLSQRNRYFHAKNKKWRFCKGRKWRNGNVHQNLEHGLEVNNFDRICANKIMTNIRIEKIIEQNVDTWTVLPV